MARRSERAYGDGRVFLPKGSRKWMVAWYVNGKEVRRSAKTESETEARNFLRRMLGNKVDDRPVPVARPCSFEDLATLVVNDYEVNGRKTLRRLHQSLGHLRRVFGQDRAADITTDRIVAYQAARLREGAALATVRLELSALKRMFRLARRHGRLHHAPDFHCPTPDNARQGFFEADDFRRVVERLPEHVRPAARFAYFTGWRRGEIVNLRWSQVDLTAGTVRLEPAHTKNRKGRLFPFSASPELDELMRAQWDTTMALQRDGRIIPHVFHRRGKPLLNFYSSWREACREAGVPGKLFHDLRRTAVRNLERAGVPRSWAKAITGHRTDSVYDRYAIVCEQDLRDAVERLNTSQLAEAERRRTIR